MDDLLKIRIGLPTETYVNMSLTELDQLTTGSKLWVGGELMPASSAASQPIEDRNSKELLRIVLLSSSIRGYWDASAGGEALAST